SSIFLTFILFQPEYLALTLALLITLSSPHPLRLSSASSPKTVITLPDILLIHRSHREVNFPRNRLIPPASRSHQSAEPRNTPQTTSVAERAVFLPPPTPSPAKMAANERMVCGLVSVSSKVETYTPKKLFPSALAACSAGLVKTVLRPR